MDKATLETYIRQLLESSGRPQVEISWQGGGEPMLRGLDFYRRSVELAERYRRADQQILHTMQTNATLVDDEWASFFRQHHFLVGVSFDGPPSMRDLYRVDRKGRGSFEQVLQGGTACGGMASKPMSCARCMPASTVHRGAVRVALRCFHVPQNEKQVVNGQTLTAPTGKGQRHD